MTITDQITDLYSAMLLLEQLEDPEYLEANGISEDEAADFKAYAQEQIAGYQAQAKEYIEWKLRQRQDLMMYLPWVEAEIERLQELKKQYKNKVESWDKWIDYLLKTFGIDKMKTEINELSYRKSEAVIFTDEEAIPAEFKKEKLTISIDKTEIKKAIKWGAEVPGAVIETRNNLQIK